MQLSYQDTHYHVAGIALFEERQTEDLKVMCSIHVHRKKNSISLRNAQWILIQKDYKLLPHVNFMNYSKVENRCK